MEFMFFPQSKVPAFTAIKKQLTKLLICVFQALVISEGDKFITVFELITSIY